MLMLPDFRVRQRDFLLEITRAITAQLDLGEVLRRVLHASVVMLAGEVGLIALRASDGLFYVRAVSEIDSNIIPLLNRHLHNLTAAPEVKSDAESFNATLKLMAEEINDELRQFVALPLVFAEEPVGLMIVFRRYMRQATPDDMKVLQSFADQAAIAVHNAQLYQRINQERKRLAAILDHSADGVMILDSNLNILRFNRALGTMTAWEPEDTIGLHQDEVITWNHLEGDDLLTAISSGWPFTLPSTAKDQASLYVEGDLIRRDGLMISLGITYAPMLSSDGKLESIIANARDITNFRKAQEMQNTFISVISHELKTPVAIIKGYAATLRRPDATWNPEVIQENLGVIEDEADRLDALIQNLLTASKLQANNQIDLAIGDVRLDQLARRSVERFSTQTDRHILTLNFKDDYPVIQGDETKLLQVIDNLIANAIKYSPDGGKIEVGGDEGRDTVSFYVRDNGVGLTPDVQRHVFDRFYRVDGSLSRKTQGTGLGLFLSKAIIEAHDGKLGVESQIGHGSVFYFELPR